MKQKVQANVLNDIANAFKTVSETLFKFFDKFDDYGIKVTKKEQLDNGGIKMWCKYGDTDFGLIVSSILDENQKSTGKSNVLVRCNKEDHKFENINDFDIDKNVIELLKKEIGLGAESDDTSGSADSSRKLQVTLQKVTSARDYTINLTSVNANYAPDEAGIVLDTILDDEDFLNAITEEPTSFEITEDGDELNIQSIPEFDVTETIHNIKTTYEKFCTETRALVEMLEFYYSNFSLKEQNEIDMFIDGINNCTIPQFGTFAD